MPTEKLLTVADQYVAEEESDIGNEVLKHTLEILLSRNHAEGGCLAARIDQIRQKIVPHRG